jgi:hypothetical protein
VPVFFRKAFKKQGHRTFHGSMTFRLNSKRIGLTARLSWHFLQEWNDLEYILIIIPAKNGSILSSHAKLTDQNVIVSRIDAFLK